MERRRLLVVCALLVCVWVTLRFNFMSSSKPENKVKRGVGRIVVTLAAWAALGWTSAANAQTAQTQPSSSPNQNTTSLVSGGLGEGGNLTLMTNKSATITTRVPFKSV